MDIWKNPHFAAGYACGKVYATGECAGMEMMQNSPYRDRIIDCTGEVPCVRRVLGTLPVTADGCVVGFAGETVWHPEVGEMRTLRGEPYTAWCHGVGRRASECYSTESAAKAAMEGGKREG
jgi:hypothetical protein